MFHSARKWTLLTALLVMVPVTIVCDVPGLDGVFEALDVEMYHDDCCYDRYYYDDYRHDCWFACDDEWFFDFDWRW